MQRLPGVFVSLVAASFTAATCANLKKQSYFFPNGVDAENGMSADLNFDDNYLRVADVVYPLGACANDGVGYCGATEYMTFYWPESGEGNWNKEGNGFEQIGSRRMSIESSVLDVRVNRSRRKLGDFEFLFQ